MDYDKVKVLFIGDPHFKIKNVEYIPLFISRIMSVVKRNHLDFIVVAGDLLDNHDKVDVEPLNLAIEFIDTLRHKIKTFVLVGNHDYKNNQQFLTNHHWMNALKWMDNVTIVDQIVEYYVEKNHKKFYFLFVPYVPPGRFIEAIETKISMDNIKNFKGVFAHQEFYGCKMGPIESNCGDQWNTDWPLVVSGHIHNKQWSQANIYYPGSAMQHAFGQSVENTITVLSFGHLQLDYEEIDLKMPKLTIKYLSISDAMKPLKYTNREFRKYKLVLEGSQEECQTFKKNIRYKQLLEEGFKISFKIKNIMVNKSLDSLDSQKKFIDILNQKIKDECDPELDTILKKFVKV
jgi:3',5'-cyclic AMP phosphodiesterase CpdA